VLGLFTLLAVQAVTPTVDRHRNFAVTSGHWTYLKVGDTSYAQFGDGIATITCDRQTRRLFFAFPGLGVTANSIMISTTYGDRTLPVPTAIGAFDPLADEIAFTRGRILVAGEGRALVLPASPVPARVVEDCRI